MDAPWGATGGVDEEADALGGIHGIKEEKVADNGVSHEVVDAGRQKTIRSRSSRPMATDSAPLMVDAGVCGAAETRRWSSTEEEGARAWGQPREEEEEEEGRGREGDSTGF